MPRWIEHRLGIWPTGPLEIEVTATDVMSQLDPGWDTWGRNLEERLAS